MRRSWLAGLLTLACVLGSVVPAQAHRPSDAYLRLTVSDSTVAGDWEIALRDLEQAVGLDADLDGTVTWGELKAQRAAITTYALARLRIASETGVCATRVEGHLVVQRTGSGFAVLRLVADCPRAIERLQIGYDLLFSIDRLHRGLAQVRVGEQAHSTVFGPDQRNWQLEIGSPDLWRQFGTYLGEGVWHIWIGFDHILFLISLLLPAALVFAGDGWRPRDDLRQTFLEVVKIVTAFTLAHSLTLGLATLGLLDLPSRLVESVIAVTIVLAALNNIRPVVTRHLWLAAFGFGLIHGVGFAGALQELGLPSDALLLSLIAFNLGVEAGQIAIVGVFLPLAFGFRKTALYPPLVLRLGSLLIAAVASLWLVERAFGVSLLA